MRREAARALGKRGDVRAVESLIGCLANADSHVRRAAAEALGELGDARWRYATSGPSRSAAEALGEIGGRAVTSLIASLKDSESSMRRSSGAALARLGYNPRDKQEKIALLIGRGDYGSLAKEGPEAVEPLIACLEDSDSHVRMRAAATLGLLGDARAVEPLIGCLKDSDAGVRRHATWALEKLGDARAVEPLTARLADPDEGARLMNQDDNTVDIPPVREVAAEALKRMGGKEAVGPLITHLKDADSRVRRLAADVLGELGDVRAVEPLIACLKDGDRDVRGWAAESLGKLGDARAAEPLIACLKDKAFGNRWAAADALGEFVDDARLLEFFIASLRDPDSDVRHYAAFVLASISTVLETANKSCPRGGWRSGEGEA